MFSFCIGVFKLCINILEFMLSVNWNMYLGIYEIGDLM